MDPFDLDDPGGFARRLVRHKAARIAARGRADRDDVEQDLLLALIAATPRYEPDKGSPTQYVTGVVRNAAANAARRLTRDDTVGLNAAGEVHGPPDPDPFADEQVKLIIDGLAGDDRAIVERLLAGTSKTAVAAALGIGRATLYRRLQAIRARLAGKDF